MSGALGGPHPPFIFLTVRDFLLWHIFLRTILVFLRGIIYYKRTIIYNFLSIKTQAELKAFSNYVFFVMQLHVELKTLFLNSLTKINYLHYALTRDFQIIR